MKIEIANKIETMIKNEEKHLEWLQSNSAPQEFIELSRWYIDYYTERLKEYRESLATPQKEVLGSGNAMGTTKILVANSKGEEIFKIKDDIITINMSHTRVKTTYEEQGSYGGTEKRELYCHHNHTCDHMTFYTENGEVASMSFGEWSTGKDLWDAMITLDFPFKDKWGGELKDGVEYYTVAPWEKPLKYLK